jgi:exodeoxyribonuclease VII small subunit
MAEAENFSIEESIKRLEEIAKLLENPETSLKASLDTYAEGVKLIKACKDNLCDVEKEMIILTGDNSDK